ncbi:Repressible high-affinity phosphate permease [Paramyrothecium foliicola]|nr:Repressible high-affinity phosphate permease [Paramyrothecium foliicola]
MMYGGNKAFHNFYNDYSHISDPNLRRRLALSEIDKVPFGLYHVRAVAVAGVGFFLDSYDIFAINLITTLLGLVFWSGNDQQDGYGGNNGFLPNPVNQALKASTSAGIVIGMIVFGWLADAFGRRRMYGVELCIIILATFSCALVSASPVISATGLLVFWRVIMGIGIGGDYPLSSVITAEFAPTRWRGAMVAAVFSMQGLGQLMAAVVALVTAMGFKESYSSIANESQCDADCRAAADRSWRIIVGVGAIPACLALYYRITIPETPRYTFDVQFDVEKADADIKAYVASKSKGEVDAVQQAQMKRIAEPSLSVPRASWKDLFDYFKELKNLRVLIGTTMSWFFLDLAFYGLGLNNTIVLHAIGYADGDNLYLKLHNQAVGMIILACAGSLPGYWTAVFTIDTIGRKPLQLIGFLLLTILFCVLGFKLHDLSEGTLLALYVVGQFLFNAGPNTTTFIVPGECFPTRYRSTGHGLSAAMGKIGAIIAQGISIPLLHKDSPANCKGNACSPFLDRLLQLFALFMLLGTLVSFLIPETKGYTLEELSGEPRTSYNAGCNGSINLESPKKSRWNPFAGGQPAGFAYPRSQASKFTSRRRSPRVGIMTDLDTMSETTSVRKPRFWRRRTNAKHRFSNDTANDIPLSSRSSVGATRDSYTNGLTPFDPTVGQHQLPTWGAGWGRIDRGRPPLMNSAQLQDLLDSAIAVRTSSLARTPLQTTRKATLRLQASFDNIKAQIMVAAQAIMQKVDEGIVKAEDEDLEDEIEESGGRYLRFGAVHKVCTSGGDVDTTQLLLTLDRQISYRARVVGSLNAASDVATMAVQQTSSTGGGLGNRALLDKIDKLRGLGITSVPLPQIVVVGDQSAGKSSVLESLTGFSFPRHVSLCTRHATEIICRREPAESIIISIVPHEATPQRQELANKFRRETCKFNSDEFAKIFEDAAKFMGIKLSPETEGSAFSRDVLRVEICGPDAEHLTVIDVPGMFENPTPGVTTKSDIPLVKQMFTGYIQEMRTIILAVVPCNGDIANQKILTLAAEVDPKGERTIGVLTKPDLAVENATKHLVVDLVNGKRRDLNLGYCVVKNRSADDASSSAEERDLQEMGFFSKEPWSNLDSDRLGISALRQRLQRLLMDRTRSEFPKVLAEVSARRKLKEILLKSLREARSTTDEQRIFLNKVASRFSELKSNALDARYTKDESFKDKAELKLITRIRELNEAFSETMRTEGHEMNFAEQEQDPASAGEYNGTHNQHTAAQKVSDNARNNLYTCGLSFAIPLEREFEVEDILCDAVVLNETSDIDLLNYIESEHMSSRGYEIGTFYSQLLRSIFKSQARRWEEITLGHISNAILVVHHFVSGILEVSCPNQAILENLRCFLLDELIGRYKTAMQQGQFLLGVELHGTSMTYHPDFEKNMSLAKEARIGRSEEFDSNVTDQKPRGKEDVETCYHIHDALRAYYEISRSRFVDVVCQQTIDHFLLHSRQGPLGILSSEVVLAMTTEQLESIAAEDLASREKRERLTHEVESLDKALKILKG